MQRQRARALAGAWVFVTSGACAPEDLSVPDRDEPQWVERGSGPRNLVLTETWEPRSGEVIDCRGGSILPATRAFDNDGLSVPDTLIFLGDVYGVRISNCTLEATFPIVAFEGGLHQISSNEIHATGRGVFLLGSDYNLVDRNVLTSNNRNVMVIGDADGNVVSRNDITFGWIGTPRDGLSGLSVPTEPDFVGLGINSYPGVTNLFVNGALYQHVGWGETHPDDLLLVGKTIDNEGWGIGAIFATRSSHPSAWFNTVEGVEYGFASFGYPDWAEFTEPGTCSDDPSMYCLLDVDEEGDHVSCALPGLEPQGTCEGVQLVLGGGRVIAPTYVGNRVSGATFAGLSAGLSEGLVLERNEAVDGYYGIDLWWYGLESATVRGNVTSGNEAAGLLLSDERPDPGTLGADISYNDFGDNAEPLHSARLEWVPDPDDPENSLLLLHPFEWEGSLPDNWWGGEPCSVPENPEWRPNLTYPSAAERPIAQAWRRGKADQVPRCD